MASSDPNLYAFELTFKALYEAKTPVSRSKIENITEAALKAQKFYKHVVMHIETFIRKSSQKHKLPGIYVMDAILRHSRKANKDKEVFAARFAKNLPATFEHAVTCVDEDRPRIFRCFRLWKESHFFPEDTIGPLLEKIQAVEAGGEISNGITNSQTDDFKKDSPDKHDSRESTLQRENSQDKSERRPEKPRFDKRLLDFDYSDEEDAGSERGGTKKLKSKVVEDEKQDDFFTLGKDGKPEFAVDKIMMGLRQFRGPLSHSQSGNGSQSADDSLADVASPMSVQSESESVPETKPHLTHLVLRSCTIWVGHLPKSVTERDLREEFGYHGTVKSVDVIPSRGCAYISFDKRKHAESAISTQSLRELWHVFSDKIKASWSPGKGIKDGYRKWEWDVDMGICRIPFELVPSNVKDLQEGSEIDETSIPEFMKPLFFTQKPQPEEVKSTSSAMGAPIISMSSSSWQQASSFMGAPSSQSSTSSVPNGPSQPFPANPGLPSGIPAFDPSVPPPFFQSNGLNAFPNQAHLQHQPEPAGQPIKPLGAPTAWSDPSVPRNQVNQLQQMNQDASQDLVASLLNNLQNASAAGNLLGLPVQSNNFGGPLGPPGRFPPPGNDLSGLMRLPGIPPRGMPLAPNGMGFPGRPFPRPGMLGRPPFPPRGPRFEEMGGRPPFGPRGREERPDFGRRDDQRGFRCDRDGSRGPRGGNDDADWRGPRDDRQDRRDSFGSRGSNDGFGNGRFHRPPRDGNGPQRNGHGRGGHSNGFPPQGARFDRGRFRE